MMSSYDPTLTSSTKNAPLRSNSAAYQASVMNADEEKTPEGYVALKELELFNFDVSDHPSNLGTMTSDQPVIYGSPPVYDNEAIEPTQPDPDNHLQDEGIQSQDPSRANSKRSIGTVDSKADDVIYLDSRTNTGRRTEKSGAKRRKSIANIPDHEYYDEADSPSFTGQERKDTDEISQEDMDDPISEMERITSDLQELKDRLDRAEAPLRRLTRKTDELAKSILGRSDSFYL